MPFLQTIRRRRSAIPVQQFWSPADERFQTGAIRVRVDHVAGTRVPQKTSPIWSRIS